MKNSERMRHVARQAMVLGAAWCLTAAAHAADERLAGTWKIASPQQTLKPIKGEVPFSDEGRERYEENKTFKAKKEYDEYDYTMSRCSSPGVPRIMLTPDRFRIYLRPGYAQMSFEWNRLIRQVAMPDLWTQQEHFISVADSPRTFGSMRGDSKGQWEGDTLVITTNNFTEKTLIDDLVPHGYDLKVTERLHLKDANTLENRITIEDPEYFSQPWDAVVTYKRQKDQLFPEDVCLDRLADGKSPLPK